METKKYQVLIGDDQFGADNSMGEMMRENFEIDYRGVLRDFKLSYTDNPEKYIEMAKTKDYKALLIDLKWCDEDAVRENKTGYRVLEAVRDCAPVRILWTSESNEARNKGYEHGATHCIAKGITPEKLEEIINNCKGVEKNGISM